MPVNRKETTVGLMDKVKSQASALADKAQEGAKVGQERLMQMQTKRQSDALLLELGGLTYLARAGRPVPGADARIEELVNQVGAYETAHGPITVTAAVPPPGESGSYVPGGAGPGDLAGQGSPAGPPAGGPPAPAPSASSVPSAATPPAQPPATPPPSAPSAGGGIPTASYASDEEGSGQGGE